MTIRTMFFWGGPKLLTAITFVVVSLYPSLVAGWMGAYAIALGVTGGGLVTLFLLARGQYTETVTTTGIFIQALLLIANFAAIYAGHGLIDPVVNDEQSAPLVRGLYFSTVTWTTLGYGDVQPKPDIRLIAALEALLGYIYFGLLVGKATNLMESID